MPPKITLMARALAPALHPDAGEGGRTMLRARLRQLAPLVLGGLCLWALAHRLQGFDTAALAAAWQQIAPRQWGLAALATAASFWAVGRYDIVVHRHLGTGLGARAAARSGVLSIALAQTLGLGVVTGALARWRALPGLPLKTCTRVSAVVALAFLSGWAVIAALARLILPAPLALGPLWALPPLAALGLAALSLTRPRLTLWHRRRVALPSLPAIGAILWLTLLDTGFAALALHALLPAALPLDLATFYPVFLIALGAALLSGTPGGVGPFDLTLFALLPHLPEPALMAGVLGFRLVYYALPAVLAALFLSLPQPDTPLPGPRPAPRPGLRDLAHATRAELGVARQNGGRMLCTAGASGIVVETGQTSTLLFDPVAGQMADLLPAHIDGARARNRIPVIYKCSARPALAARRAGFRLWHVADEALIEPVTFDLSARSRRQLRRKLRQAAKAGVTISRPAHLPLAAMARVDADWRARQGGARGLTMGRFDAAYLDHHQVFLAHANGALQGFATFHVSAHELCLDIMRSASGAPPGTMHALIAQAITQAAANGRRRLSLAAVPALGRAPGPCESRLRRAVSSAAGGQGLAQFKASFAPRYAPLYLAAPSRAGLLVAAADLALSVRAASPAHDHSEQFGIAPAAPI